MRLFNRLLVFALGVVLAGLGFVIAAEAVWTGLGYRFLWFPGKQWLHTLRTTPWSTRSVLIGAAVTAALGLILVIAEVWPRPRRLARTMDDQPNTWLIHRRSAEKRLRRRLEGIVPRSPIKAGLRTSSRRWRLSLRARAAVTTRTEIEAAAKRELEKLGAPSASTVTVRTTREPRVQ